MDFGNFFSPYHKIIESQELKKGNLYLGSQKATYIVSLQECFVDAVLTIADDVNVRIQDRNHLYLKVPDTPSYIIGQHFDECYKFIEDNLQKTNVLIHCFAGVSRSATITAAYLMKKNNWTAQQALENIREKRKIISPNAGFVRQLNDYEKQLQQLK